MKVEVKKDGWRRVRASPLTQEDKELLARERELYCLQVEQDRKDRLSALSRIPTNRVIGGGILCLGNTD